MQLRGIILAGGKGTRLGELTRVTNKHLLPVGPYPMVYHPLKKLVGAELDGNRVTGIEEKPANPKTDCAVAGIYVYPADVFDVIQTLKPSGRGELEITDVNRHYLAKGRLGYTMLDNYWTDAGTPES